MKTCSLCDSLVFGKGLCQYHWKIQYSKPLKRTPIKKSVRKIVNISEKKKLQDEEYYSVCRELDTKAKSDKEWICFFCGKPLGEKHDHHHVAGKSGKSDNGILLYLDKSGIVLCHRKCHRWYHDMEISELLKAPFYKALMEKIYYLCKSKYYNMKAKHDEHREI